MKPFWMMMEKENHYKHISSNSWVCVNSRFIQFVGIFKELNRLRELFGDLQ